MKNILLYQHGGSKNHGCEALARTVTTILKEQMDVSATLCSNHPEEDALYGLDQELTIIQNNQILKRYSPKWFLYQADRRITKSRALQEAFLTEKNILRAAEGCDLAIAIGGDNYCYHKGRQFWPTDRKLKKKGVSTMLWGCSIEPEDLDREFAAHLSLFDLITVRESVSFDAMAAAGIPREKMFLLPDPAFTLPADELPLPEGFSPDNTVGINVSPMIIGCERSQGATMENYVALMDYILKETEMHIALIPHVVWEDNDDRVPLSLLYKKFWHTDRVVLLPDCGCSALKGYIARLRFFIGARTHATIAAYSSGVPTLVVGYSVKARGIARDLFGTEEGYVLPVQSLTRPEELTAAFCRLAGDADRIRTRLNTILPSYRQAAFAAGQKAAQLLGEYTHD